MVTPIRTPHRSSLGITLAIIALVAAIAYIIIPADFDGPIYGIIDDFFFFMAAFCFAQSQFISPVKLRPRAILKRFATIFTIMGILTLATLAAITIL